jgi:arylsulfatase A
MIPISTQRRRAAEAQEEEARRRLARSPGCQFLQSLTGGVACSQLPANDCQASGLFLHLASSSCVFAALRFCVEKTNTLLNYYLRRLLAISFLFVGLVDSFGAEKQHRTPNIVFILIDDMGWTDGSCFGSKFYKTPNLDRLAAGGMRFSQAYAACAVCSPTRAAIMTGKYPARLHITDWIAGEGTPDQSRFRVPEWEQQLPLAETTLAEALKPLGFVSACIGKWHLGGTNFNPAHQGFDVSIAAGAMGQPASYFWPYGKPAQFHRVPDLAENGGKTGEYLTDRLTDEALKFIEKSRRQAFFLYLPHYAVHSPLMAKEAFTQQYAKRSGANGQSNSVYAAMLQSVDESVGRILDKLDDLKLADQTIIVFTSDNGGAVHFGKPPVTSNSLLRLGKGYPYEGGLRVPLIVKVPGITAGGSVCNAPVISMDFFPTLLELAGAGSEGTRTAADGISLVTLLRGKNSSLRQEFFWHYPHYWNGKGALPVTPYSVARVGNWKLIRFYESERDELYDLAKDPGETRDIADSNPQKKREVAKRLDGWLKEVGAQMPVAR